jgi:hypothetical protein
MPHHAVHPHTQYVLEREQWERSLERARQSRNAPVTPASDSRADPKFVMATTEDFFGHVDMRIKQTADVVLDAAGTVIGCERKDFQAALDKRDREIELLRRELGTLRAEVELKLKLKSELAALKTEIEQARRLQPNFDGKLNVLQAQVEKLTKQTTRLRAGHSTLDYQRQQSDKRMTTTRLEVTSVGEQTREVLQRLRASGFDLMDETASPSGFVS